MPLPLTVSCFSKIQIGITITFLVPAHLGRPGQRAIKWVCVYVTFCDSAEQVDFFLYLLKYCGVCVWYIVFPSVFFPVVLWRRDFWKFRNYQIANKILDIFCISILFSECFGKKLRRKWTVEKKVYIHNILQACEIMHIVGGPLQRNDVLTFSSCLNWIEVMLSFHCWSRASHLLNERNWKWLCWKSFWMCVSVLCDNGKYLRSLFFWYILICLSRFTSVPLCAVIELYTVRIQILK